MTFLTLQQELADRLVAYDETVTADATKLKRWLNMAVQYICGKKLWPFMITEEFIQTVADYTTGTVTVTAGSTTATTSAIIADSKTGQYIQFASSNDWYKITAHTAGTATLTISPAAISANTAALYTIRKLLYTTTTPLKQIIDMKQMVTPIRLMSVGPVEADFFMPLYLGTGSPNYYIMSSPSSTGTPQFSFLPSPSTVINVMIRGVKNLSDMSADADEPLIPINWQDAIVNIAAFYGFQGLDDTRAATELTVGESRISDMAKNMVYDLGRHRIMRAADDWAITGIDYVMPSNFGPWIS